MSCSIVSIPFALMWVVGTIISNNTTINDSEQFYNAELTNQDLCKNNYCTDDNIITEQHFIEKNFETPFMDRDILLKTLEEHGIKNIVEWENGIAGDVDKFKLTFEKPENDKPYNLRISCLENENATETVEDLNSEYALNVQEDAYLHIVEKLKDNNMQIETEEVMDDNTIVLTINVD